MKRMKKLLTGLLTLGMTLSMMTMTAFAAGPSAKMPTIDEINRERLRFISIQKVLMRELKEQEKLKPAFRLVQYL